MQCAWSVLDLLAPGNMITKDLGCTKMSKESRQAQECDLKAGHAATPGSVYKDRPVCICVMLQMCSSEIL